VSGWGYTKKKKIDSNHDPYYKSKYLQLVDIKIVSKKECARTYDNYDIRKAFEEKQPYHVIKEYKQTWPKISPFSTCAYGKGKGKFLPKNTPCQPKGHSSTIILRFYS